MAVFFCVHFPSNKTHKQCFLCTKSGLKVGISITCGASPCYATSHSCILWLNCKVRLAQWATGLLMPWTCFPGLADLIGSKELCQELSTFSRHWLAMALVISLLIPHLIASAGPFYVLSFLVCFLGSPLSFRPCLKEKRAAS